MPRTKKTETPPAEKQTPSTEEEAPPVDESLVKVLITNPIMTKDETHNAGAEPEVPAEQAEEWISAGFAEALE